MKKGCNFHEMLQYDTDFPELNTLFKCLTFASLTQLKLNHNLTYVYFTTLFSYNLVHDEKHAVKYESTRYVTGGKENVSVPIMSSNFIFQVFLVHIFSEFQMFLLGLVRNEELQLIYCIFQTVSHNVSID